MFCTSTSKFHVTVFGCCVFTNKKWCVFASRFLIPFMLGRWLLWKWSPQTGLCTLLSKCEHWNTMSVYCNLSGVDCVWNVKAHAQKPDFVFRRNVRVHLNRRGSQFSRLLAAEVCASAVVMLDTPCSEVVWRVLSTHSIRQFPLHFPSRASTYAITFQLDSTYWSTARDVTWHIAELSCTRIQGGRPSKKAS